MSVEVQAPKRVVIVDPDERFGTLLQHHLQGAGLSATHVSHGRAALRLLTEAAADVLVTELDGDELDAFELLEAIAREPGRPAVVLCTRRAGAAALTPDVLRTLGVDDVVARPCRLEAVAEAVQAALMSQKVASSVEVKS